MRWHLRRRQLASNRVSHDSNPSKDCWNPTEAEIDDFGGSIWDATQERDMRDLGSQVVRASLLSLMMTNLRSRSSICSFGLSRGTEVAWHESVYILPVAPTRMSIIPFDDELSYSLCLLCSIRYSRAAPWRGQVRLTDENRTPTRRRAGLLMRSAWLTNEGHAVLWQCRPLPSGQRMLARRRPETNLLHVARGKVHANGTRPGRQQG